MVLTPDHGVVVGEVGVVGVAVPGEFAPGLMVVPAAPPIWLPAALPGAPVPDWTPEAAIPTNAFGLKGPTSNCPLSWAGT